MTVSPGGGIRAAVTDRITERRSCKITINALSSVAFPRQEHRTRVVVGLCSLWEMDTPGETGSRSGWKLIASTITPKGALVVDSPHVGEGEPSPGNTALVPCIRLAPAKMTTTPM